MAVYGRIVVVSIKIAEKWMFSDRRESLVLNEKFVAFDEIEPASANDKNVFSKLLK